MTGCPWLSILMAESNDFMLKTMLSLLVECGKSMLNNKVDTS